MMINHQVPPPSTMYLAGKPFVLAQQSLCQRIPVQRHNQFPGNDPSHAAEIAHGLIVSLNSVVVGFIYVRNDGTVIYEDGFIDGPSVPRASQAKALHTLRIPPQVPASGGALITLKADPLMTLFRAGFALTSCY